MSIFVKYTIKDYESYNYVRDAIYFLYMSFIFCECYMYLSNALMGKLLIYLNTYDECQAHCQRKAR